MLEQSTSSKTTTEPDLWLETFRAVTKTVGIEPYPEWRSVLFHPSRIKVVMGGEGAGKSYMAALFATCKSVHDSLFIDKGLYWIVGADFEDARKEFDYILEFQEKLQNVRTSSAPSHNDQQCFLETKTGAKFITISAYDATKLGRDEPDGIVGAEISRWFEEAFLRCEGRLARKYPRSWGFFSGSPQTALGWFPDLWRATKGGEFGRRGIMSFSVPTWANQSKFPKGIDDPAILALREGNSENRFMARYGGEPLPPQAVVFSEFRVERHVRNVEHTPGVPVYLAIDPGTKVYSVLFVQLLTNGDVVVLDELYGQRPTHRQVIETVRSNPLWPYVKGGTIDVAARAQVMGMPIPLEEWYRDTGMVLTSAKWPLDDSIERVRLALSINSNTGKPRLQISSKCRGIISEMGGGASPVDDGGPWLYVEHRDGLGPPENRNNHSCMALAYLLAGPYGFRAEPGYWGVEKMSGPVSYLRRDRADRDDSVTYGRRVW